MTPWQRESLRSTPFAARLSAAVAKAGEPLSIGDLLEAGGPACCYTDVVRWLNGALRRGEVRETAVELDREGRPRDLRRFVRP